MGRSDPRPRSLRELHLLTAKPFLYVFNMDESDLSDEGLKKQLADLVSPAEAIFLDATTEADLAELEADAATELRDLEPPELPHGLPGLRDRGRDHRAAAEDRAVRAGVRRDVAAGEEAGAGDDGARGADGAEGEAGEDAPGGLHRRAERAGGVGAGKAVMRERGGGAGLTDGDLYWLLVACFWHSQVAVSVSVVRVPASLPFLYFPVRT